MERHISIYVDLIAEIIGLPIDGEKPEHYLDERQRKNI
jgi:hypothetical protein